MFKYFVSIISILLFFISVLPVFAQNVPSFVSVVNPVRGSDFWDLKDQQPADAVLGQSKIINQANLPATWLIRFDALVDPQIIKIIKTFPQNNEIGLFLEVTPSWAKAAGITYRSSENWHLAGSAFLTGYAPAERERLINVVFENYKNIFGFYPKSVGAWYIDSYSLSYMQKKYAVESVLIVADQHTTDSYQVWGQFWSTPYYPSQKNTLMPAQSINDKLPLVVMQWAARDPVNGYGKGVEESTYSVQANDYLDYHKLNINYFSKLVDIYTLQKLNQFNQIVIGLENSYSWKIYQSEYQNQINIVAAKRNSGQISVVVMRDFSSWYQEKFPATSPPHVITAPDPLGSKDYSVWFMNPFYRVGWFFNRDGSVFRDVRPYNEGREEQCYGKPCDQLSFATFALWTIDEVTRNQKFILDPGVIKGINLSKNGDKYLLTYINEADRSRKIEFLPRDIAIDGNVKSIDSFILNAVSTNQNTSDTKGEYPISTEKIPQISLFAFFLTVVRFLIFGLFFLFIPGFLLARLFKETLLTKIFLAFPLGFVTLTLIAYFSGYLKLPWLVYLFLGLMGIFFIKDRCYLDFQIKNFSSYFSKFNLGVVLIIIAGTIFQSLALIRSGWIYDFGIGFWGPLGHDGIWHQALINQLMHQVPPQNPGFSGTSISNYHYFFDLIVAVFASISQIPVIDLLYRFFPVLFSLLLGTGTYLLSIKLFSNRAAALISLYFTYFAGSFGWVVEYLREKHYGGESAFWANQPVSFNLNPPFAISLVLIIAVMLIFLSFTQQKSWKGGIVLALIIGSLIEFKVYAGIIVLGGLGVVSLAQIFLYRNTSLFKVFLGSLLLSLLVFLPQNSKAGDLLVFAPLWFVHSMIDFPDRVGWTRLSLARQMAPIRGEWPKFFLVEIVSVVLFIVGNLGMRFIAFLGIVKAIQRRLWFEEKYLFIGGMAIFSLVIPLLFIQKGNPWNTIQFLYYFLYFMALASGISLVSFSIKFPRYLNYLFLSLILVITPINAVVTFQSAFSTTPPSRLTSGEYQGLNFLQDLPQGVVLTYPFDKKERSKFKDPFPLVIYETSNYVSAFSGKTTFIEDEMQQEIFQNDYKKRIIASTDFFKGRETAWSINFLKTNNIRYIYLPKLFGVKIDEEAMGLRKIYDNKEVTIFETAI